MTVGQNPDPNVCPECGAHLDNDASECWLCRHTLTEDSAEPEPVLAEIVPLQGAETVGRHFWLITLLLVVTLVAVLLGLFVQLPGLAIILSVLITPALLKTVLLGRQRYAAGAPRTAAEKQKTFITSLFLVVTIMVAMVIAAGGAFFVACLGVGIHEGGFALLQSPSKDANDAGLVFANVAALVALVFGVWFFLLRRRKV